MEDNLQINDNISLTVDAYMIPGTEQYIYRQVGVIIAGNRYPIIDTSFAVRSKSDKDGYYHLIYIQINMSTGEYYIGKVNNKSWGYIKRYQGSGLLFKSKYEKHSRDFVRYYIAICNSAKESEELEAQIVNRELLSNPFCLNLVAGGGGTSEHINREERSLKQKQLMQLHPERYAAMIAVAKERYLSGDSIYLEQRSNAIKKTMSSERYRTMSRERLEKWRREHPEEYQLAREKNLEAIRNPEVSAKKKASRKRWIEEHPEEYKKNLEKVNVACNTPEARKKRSDSLKQWYIDNPEKAKANNAKRSKASVEKCRKSVAMTDLETGEVIKTFLSQHEAAAWLVEQGIAKNMNCVSSISAVCRKSPCTTGYGYRKKSYGYGWKFVD